MAWQKYKPQIEIPNKVNNALEYKDHNEFFTKFYEIRTKLIFSMSLQAKKYDLAGMKDLYVSLNDLVEWTCDYIDFVEIDKKMKIIDDDLNKLSNKTQITTQQYDVVFEKIKSVWRTISNNHTKNELIPRVQVNTTEEDPFKDEKDTAKRTMYKVVMKLFENV